MAVVLLVLQGLGQPGHDVQLLQRQDAKTFDIDRYLDFQARAIKVSM